MIELEDEIWKTFEGGYRVIYDASILLKKLVQTDDPKVTEEIVNEFWNELHHQGDVGIASYMALPYLVDFALRKNYSNWKLIGLCAVIEQQRVLGANPALPDEYASFYFKSLSDLRKYLLATLDKKLSRENYQVAVSMICACDEFHDLSRDVYDIGDL